MEIRKIHTYIYQQCSYADKMWLWGDAEYNKSCECIAPVFIANSLCAPYIWVYGIHRSSCACRLCKYVYKINVSNQEPWKVGYIYWSKYFALQALHGTIGHEAVYTSLWLGVSLRIPLSMACSWKKRLVHVRVHYSVWKVIINVVTSLNVQVLVFVS